MLNQLNLKIMKKYRWSWFNSKIKDEFSKLENKLSYLVYNKISKKHKGNEIDKNLPLQKKLI